MSIVRASGKSKKGAYKIGEGEGTVDVIAPGEGRSDDQDGHSIGDGERVGESRWGRRRRRGDGAGERGSDPAPEVGFSVGRGLLLALLLIGGLLLGRFALGGKGGDG